MKEERAVKGNPAHEKVRFGKEDMVDLSAMPSSDGIPFASRKLHRRSRTKRWGIRFAVLAASLFIGILAILQLVSLSGFGAQRLTDLAQTELRAFFGQDIDARIGDAKFSAHGFGTLALDLSDVEIAKANSKDVAVSAKTLSLRLNNWSILTGKPRIGSASLEDAHILVGAMPGQGDMSWVNGLLDANGLLDPDKVLQFVFDAANNASRMFASHRAPRVDISNVEFELPVGAPSRSIVVDSATFHRTPTGVSLSGVAKADGTKAYFGADITSNAHDGLADAFNLTFNTESQAHENKGVSLGTTAVALSGSRAPGNGPERLEATISGDGLSVDLGKRGRLEGKLDLYTVLSDGSGKLSIERLDTSIGRSNIHMSGAIVPGKGDNGAPGYNFDLTSSNSTLGPQDTNEPDMPVELKLSGQYIPDQSLISIGDIGIRNSSGTASGRAAVRLAEQGPPGIMLSLDVAGMSVSHVKQLWPWFAAEPARRWVNQNLFGGTVPSGSIRFEVPPGRLGNGQKLSGDEVSGKFEVSQTRFDIAGLLPPAREAIGTVSFAGDDVEITMESGKVFLENGKSVSASQGRLVIDNADQRPVIGTLDIKVAGDASAVAEFASLDPINAMDHTSILPQSLSGQVEGDVHARIPMHKGIDPELLTWDVSLAFKGLAINQKIEGHTISNADGTIRLDKTKAVIEAGAEINGVPAQLNLTEPFAKSAVQRERDIVLVLDEKTQRKISGSINDFIGGTVRFDVRQSAPGKQRFEADLTSNKLSLPVVGWSKGEGVPARLKFEVDSTASEAIRVADFELSGASFAIKGQLDVASGELKAARFSQFRLTRNDEVSVTIERSGKGYAIAVDGESLDARALVRQFVGKDKGGQSAGKSPPISVKAKVKKVAGFNDESLNGVVLSYSAANTITGLSLEASTNNGGAVNASNTPDGAGRRLRVTAQDAGALLRFVDVYGRMQGGTAALSMASSGNNFAGQLDIRNFWIVNEPKLGSIVSAAPSGGQRSLNEAVRGRIDTSRVQFERGFADLEKGPSYLRISNGVLRGPAVGTTFRGTVYDENNQIDLSGTFMPAYGLNRIFGELPLIGEILGNGNDRGLIGVTYKLAGDYNSPKLQINPLSAIAPGIFRNIFEFQ
ncbi:MAG: hypothetical protein KF874_15285 [Rhizobiaceae bacterium]|nr:hypothetical protein [Rhizobiaceae bacterium]